MPHMTEEEIRKAGQDYYRTCPLCRGPTRRHLEIEKLTWFKNLIRRILRRDNNIIEYRECIACLNPQGEGYKFKMKKISNK